MRQSLEYFRDNFEINMYLQFRESNGIKTYNSQLCENFY